MLSIEQASTIILDALSPRHFTADDVAVVHVPNDKTPWEIFRGRLLEPRFTRQERTFVSWKLHYKGAAEPLITVKLDTDAKQIHVTRSLHSYVWENQASATNVIEGQEATRWLPELVGSLSLIDFASEKELRDELESRVFQAFVGTSRLPLNSVEAPLPCFTFGELAYFPHFDGVQLESDATYLEQTKWLEFRLRATPGPTDCLVEMPLLRNVFNEVSLSPYTRFVDTALAFVQNLDVADEVDFLGHLLRQSTRHLTAYDLVVFHHRGANYPDALLLDAVLNRFLACIEAHPELADEPRRRRALRQGCLLRFQYQNLPVPDAPTSPGENARVLPAPRVPEDQILNPAKRTRRLFEHEPLSSLLGPAARKMLKQSIEDLKDVGELRELGTAIFIDRPLGRGKLPGEPDQTLLLAHECFSANIAKRRLGVLAELTTALKCTEYSVLSTQYSTAMDRLGEVGLPIHLIPPPDRPIISLNDAARVSPDFRVVRTLRGSVREFLASFESEAIRRLCDSPFLIVPVISSVDQTPVIGVFDATYQRRCELKVNQENGFRIKGRNEYPAAGLTLLGPSPAILPPIPRTGFDRR